MFKAIIYENGKDRIYFIIFSRGGYLKMDNG
jgi:hypothetical protein